MNYLLLKSVIESLTKSYLCQDCNSKITDWNIKISKMDNSKIQLEIKCPKCGCKWMVEARLEAMPQFWEENNSWKQNLSQFKNILNQIKEIIIKKNKLNKNIKKINNLKKLKKMSDWDILNLRKHLEESSSVDDLLK